jgi:hypothetical protein
MRPRITIICGAYGSGKTEYAISCAIELAKDRSVKAALIDLDIVNPYFRSRDIAAELAEQGVTVISTEPGYENSDLPALSPRIFAAFQDESYQVVIDVGGDPNGARALGRFREYFLRESYQFHIVVNPYRPNTRNVKDTLKLINELAVTSRLQPNGLISNINLGPETTLEIWQEGLPFIRELAKQSNLPMIRHVVEEHFWAKHQDFFANIPVYPITLRMLTPWLKENRGPEK